MSRAGSEVRGTSSLNEQLYTGVTGPKGAEKPPSEAPHRERPGERIRWGRRRRQTRGTALFLFDVEKSARSAVSSAAAGVRSLLRRDGLCTRDAFTHPRPVHRSRSLPLGAWEASRQETLRFIRRAPCGAGRLSQIVQATAKRTQRSRQFSLPTEKIYRTTGLFPRNTGKLYRTTGCRGLTTNRFPHRSPVKVKSGRGWKRKSRLHTEKSPWSRQRRRTIDVRSWCWTPGGSVGKKIGWSNAKTSPFVGAARRPSGRPVESRSTGAGINAGLLASTASSIACGSEQAGGGGLGIRGSAPSVGHNALH
jgi:hypothetical protein